MELVSVGEYLHVIERRAFPGDVRRHFIGVVEAASQIAIRVRGWLFVYDSGKSEFVKKPEPRTRVIPIDNQVILNILPPEVDVDAVRYFRDSDGNLSLTDSAGFELDVSEFGPKD